MAVRLAGVELPLPAPPGLPAAPDAGARAPPGDGGDAKKGVYGVTALVRPVTTIGEDAAEEGTAPDSALALVEEEAARSRSAS
jgi:hypothetical protein